MTRIACAAVLAAAAVLTAGAALAQTRTPAPSAAPVWPWCAEYDMEGAVVNCGFATREQCLATVSGVGGGCRPNAFASPPSAPQRPGPSDKSHLR